MRKRREKKTKIFEERLEERVCTPFVIYRTHIKVITMQSIAQVQNVQKINAVSTGKVANEKSMMVWRPHGNKYV